MQPDSMKAWHKQLKRQMRNNDLNALRLYFAFRANLAWNAKLK